MEDYTALEHAVLLGLFIVELCFIVGFVVVGAWLLREWLGTRRYNRERERRYQLAEQEKALQQRRREESDELRLTERLRQQTPIAYDSKTTKPASPRPGARPDNPTGQ